MPVRRKKWTESSSHRFHQMLHHLGWSLSALPDPQPFVFGRSRTPRAQLQTAPLPDGQYLLLFFLDEGLPALEEAFKSYEDFTPLHAEMRHTLNEQGLLTRQALLLDSSLNAELVDFEAEDILIDARGEADIADRLLPLLHLNKLASGSLTTFPRKTPRQRARELGDWTRVWANRIGSAAGSNQPTVTSFFSWLMLARLVERLRLGPSTKLPLCEYGVAAPAPKAVRFINGVFKPLVETWNLLQGQSLEVQKRVAEVADERGQLTHCLESFARLSVSKFSASVFAEAFADEELRSTGWRQSLIESPIAPEENPARWLIESVEVDLDEVGFPGVLARFDAVTEDLRRLAREQAVLRARGERPGLQLDFFGEEPPQLDESEAPRMTLERTLRIRTTQRARAELARLVLLAHAAEWEARLRRREPIFGEPRIVYTSRESPPPPPRPKMGGMAELN